MDSENRTESEPQVRSSELLACAIALVGIVEGPQSPMHPWRSKGYRCGGRLKDHEKWCAFYVAVNRAKRAQANEKGQRPCAEKSKP